MIEYKKFLKENGFDVKIVGAKYFIDLLEEVVEKILDGYDISEIKELYPSICLEYYHFVYEVSRFKYLEELDYFSRNGYRGDNEIEKKLWDEPTVDKLIRLGNKYILEKKEQENCKQLIKNKNCKVFDVFNKCN